MKILKGVVALTVVLFVFLMALFEIVTSLGDGERARQSHAALLQELRCFPVPPDTSLVDEVDWFSRWKPHNITVGSEFHTRLPLDPLVAFYNERLGSRGFHFKKPVPIRDYGRDTGMQQEVYCKGDLQANITYSSRDASYFLSLSWTDAEWARLKRWLGLPPAPVKDCFGNLGPPFL